MTLLQDIDIIADSVGVTFGYRSGLPVISVPLPSRNEQCNFALRPVSSTVGNFLASVRYEDKGIDRAQIYSQGLINFFENYFNCKLLFNLKPG